MNLEIGTEAALFPEKEYISGIFLAVCELFSPSLGLRIWLLYVTDGEVDFSSRFQNNDPDQLHSFFGKHYVLLNRKR
jgi:hypothetical protein